MSRRPKKRCAVCGQDIVPDLLVDPGNPPHRHQACTTAHPTRAHHHMVTLAKSSPSRSTPRPSQNENATVMLGRVLVNEHWPAASRVFPLPGCRRLSFVSGTTSDPC